MECGILKMLYILLTLSCLYYTITIAIDCDYVKTYENHLLSFKAKKAISHYIPSHSCFMCINQNQGCYATQINCNVIEKRNFPLYNNMLEIGFFGSDLPLKAHIRVPLSNRCYLKIDMFTRNENEVGFDFWQCNFDHICTDAYTRSFVKISEEGCVFLSVILNKNNEHQMYVSVSDECIILASAITQEETIQQIFNPECYFQGFEKVPNSNFVIQLRDNDSQGIVVIVPCSPGGYTVDKDSGRFVFGYPCKALFFPEVHGDRVDQIIDDQYAGNEHLQFPKRRLSSQNDYELFRPVYIYENGSAKPTSKMVPKMKIYKTKRPKLVRDRCELYEKLAYGTVDELMKAVDGIPAKDNEEIITEIVKTTKKGKPTTTTKTATTITTVSNKASTLEDNVNVPSSGDSKVKREASPNAAPEQLPALEVVVQPEFDSGDIPTDVKLNVTFEPAPKMVENEVEVSLKNDTKMMVELDREGSLFAKVTTLKPENKPFPALHTPWWIPSDEELTYAIMKYGNSRRKRKLNNNSRQHDPLIKVKGRNKNKIDHIFSKFDEDWGISGVDYFGIDGVDSSGQSGQASGVDAPTSEFSTMFYKIKIFIFASLLCLSICNVVKGQQCSEEYGVYCSAMNACFAMRYYATYNYKDAEYGCKTLSSQRQYEMVAHEPNKPQIYECLTLLFGQYAGVFPTDKEFWDKSTEPLCNGGRIEAVNREVVGFETYQAGCERTLNFYCVHYFAN